MGLILSLRDWGVDYNETNIKGIRPLDAMLRFGVLSRNFEGLMDIGLELLDSGMEFSDSWWPEQNLVSKVHWGNYHRHLAMCLIRYRQVDEVVDGLQCGRLTRAILLRSEAKVSQIVEELPDCLRERNSVGHTPMHLAASWPAGISILLDAGGENLVNEPDNAGFLPLAYASYSKCLAAVRLLLDADCTLYTHEPVILDDFDLLEYTSDVIWDALTWSSEEVAKCIIQALADRRRRLAAIAFQELPCGLREVLALSPGKVIDANAAHVYSLLKENNILLPHSLLVPSWWQTIYHVLFRQEFWCSDTISKPIESPTKWADIFYNAGFHDFVEQDESRGNLLMMDFELFEVPCLAKVVNLILWFLRKGLSLELKMLRLNDDGKYIPHTPASLYVGRLIIHMLSKEPEALKDPITRKELVSLLKKVITERASDDCECSCSLDGCYAITAMMKESVRRYSEWDSQVHEFITWLVNLLDIANDGWSFIPANIIRFLTFERLELTHTCCVWQDGEPSYFAILDGDDRIEIQEEESADLSVLETLMEEFRHAFVYLGVPLTEFLQAYWMPRMEEVMGSPLAISEDEARQICELGVTWEPRKPRGILSPISSPREDGDMTLPRQTENLPKRQHSF